jgi:glutamate/tyrosine decarboxylase-like PLP-dependent enzyme
LIAAIARTTNAGVIDPLLKITKIAEEKKYG